jgi:hypothetical protein
MIRVGDINFDIAGGGGCGVDVGCGVEMDAVRSLVR